MTLGDSVKACNELQGAFNRREGGAYEQLTSEMSDILGSYVDEGRTEAMSLLDETCTSCRT